VIGRKLQDSEQEITLRIIILIIIIIMIILIIITALFT